VKDALQNCLLIVRAAVLGTAILTLGACATVPATPEEAVAARAQAYLDALLSQDIEKAYQFTSPGYRELNSFALYRLRVAGVGAWRGGEVGAVSCQEDVCDVELMVTYRLIRQRMENTRPINHRWIKSDGNWWISMR
jgi:hypothetical protein